MNTIPEWEELEAFGQFDDYGSMYRYLCKLHVQNALESAAEKAEAKVMGTGDTWAEVDENSILNSYDLNLIK